MAGKPRLDEQLCGYNPNTGKVVAIQRWSGFERRRCALVVCVDDQVTFQRGGTGVQVRDWYRLRTLGDGFVFVTEERARHELARRDKPQRQCVCDSILPIGGQWCTTCGMSKERRQELTRP